MDNHRVILTLCALLATACGVCKHTPPVTQQTDSVRVEIHEHVVHDTARFEVPIIIENNVTRDTASHLENKFAVSDAVVSDGLLYHSLKTKPQTISVPVDVAVTDTLYIEKEAQIRTEIVEVEKELTWWQKFRLGAFWWLMGLGLIGWRREIIALIKKLIKLF